jgi:hypothetical protein
MLFHRHQPDEDKCAREESLRLRVESADMLALIPEDCANDPESLSACLDITGAFSWPDISRRVDELVKIRGERG